MRMVLFEIYFFSEHVWITEIVVRMQTKICNSFYSFTIKSLKTKQETKQNNKLQVPWAEYMED